MIDGLNFSNYRRFLHLDAVLLDTGGPRGPT